MNGAGSEANVVTALLPSGNPVRVEVVGMGPGDGVASVGLRDLDIGAALDTVGEIGSVLVERMKAARPTRARVELKLGFAIEAGKLTALVVSGRGDASLTVTLEWLERTEGDG